MNFLESDREYEGWLPIITVLLGTGMRIGECIAIRWEDLDFENRMISVNHNLTDRPDSKGVCRKRIETPKTEAGTRMIPMIQEVFDAKREEREPVLLPDFSAHNLRHTFCTRLCENETNLKVIMSIMGHADISTTMDIYAECTKEKKKEVMTNIEGCIIIK